MKGRGRYLVFIQGSQRIDMTPGRAPEQHMYPMRRYDEFIMNVSQDLDPVTLLLE